MKILVNRKIKLLFYRIIFFIVVFSMLSIALIMLRLKNAAWYVLVSSLCIDILILAVGYWHFKEQNKIMEALNIYNDFKKVMSPLSATNDVVANLDRDVENRRLQILQYLGNMNIGR